MATQKQLELADEIRKTFAAYQAAVDAGANAGLETLLTAEDTMSTGEYPIKYRRPTAAIVHEVPKPETNAKATKPANAGAKVI